MDPQFDFSRLESNLYLDLLAVFNTTSGMAVIETEDGGPPWMGAVLHIAEDLAIHWLKGGLPRTIDTLLNHLWPSLCGLAMFTGKEAEAYEEDADHFHEVLGLTDDLGKEPESWMILTGLSSCARALTAERSDDAYLYAFHASVCKGMVVGAQWVHEDAFLTSKVDRERLAHAGRMSGKARRKQAKASPQAVLELEQRLLRDGKGVRDTASIIAARLGVTPEYVRQLRRKVQN